jgi:PKD repeat protein
MYLNVWVSASANGAAGYTYRPGSVANFPTGDGIVLLHSYTGSIGTSSPYRSHTLTHEVGHWINLAHTWGNSNDPGLPENCDEDDNVSDTPNTIGWTSCNVNGNTCGGGVDNVENYMEYSYCGKMFTLGQATRMTAALNSSIAQRNQLWQTANLVATGVNSDAQLCSATFTGNGGVICAGTSVAFQDLSFHNVTSRTWSFPGGEPSVSAEENPVVTYEEPGVYPVSLTVSDGNNTLTTTSQNYVTVLPVPGNPGPFSEGFEEISPLTGETWTVRDPNGGNGFALTNVTSFSGDKCVRLNNNVSNYLQIDELVSTTYDMSNVESITISFRYAFAKRSVDNDDRLRVYVSPNCGGVWSLRKQLRGNTDLPTAPNTNSTFVPSDESQWGYAVVDNIPADYFLENFRFKFWFQSDGGNNLYIDDINLNGVPVVGIGQLELSGSSMVVLPNPVTDAATLMFDTDRSDRVKLTMHDVLGRELATLHNGLLPAGEQRIQIPVNGLRSGMYFIRLTSGNGDEVVRFVVE